MRKKKGGHGGGGGGHDGAGGMRWLLTYSDVVTLLLALFIFLYSISEISAAKFSAFTQAMAQIFNMGKTPESPQGGMGILPGGNSILDIQMKMQKDFQEEISEGAVTVEQSQEGLVLRMKDNMFFGLGSADGTPGSDTILQKIAGYVSKLPNQVRVEGHTDDLPVKGGRFRSNWELSAARAASVAGYLIDKGGIRPGRISIAGYGEFKPLKPNLPGFGSSANRRVEIVILNQPGSQSPPSSRLAPSSSTGDGIQIPGENGEPIPSPTPAGGTPDYDF